MKIAFNVLLYKYRDDRWGFKVGKKDKYFFDLDDSFLKDSNIKIINPKGKEFDFDKDDVDAYEYDNGKLYCNVPRVDGLNDKEIVRIFVNVE